MGAPAGSPPSRLVVARELLPAPCTLQPSAAGKAMLAALLALMRGGHVVGLCARLPRPDAGFAQEASALMTEINLRAAGALAPQTTR